MDFVSTNIGMVQYDTRVYRMILNVTTAEAIVDVGG